MPGLDSYTKLLLHCNGTDGSQTFIDSALGKAVTAVGHAKISTAQSKFGGASGLFDGTGDCLTTPNHADFDFGSGDFTIDFWVMFNVVENTRLITKAVNTSAFAPFGIFTDATKLYFASSANGTTWGVLISFLFGGVLTTGVWYHIAAVRYGNVWNLHVDGILRASTTVSQTVMTNTTVVSIGACADASASLNGWIDELRISKGIARWIANFAPPNYAYGFNAGGFSLFM